MLVCRFRVVLREEISFEMHCLLLRLGGALPICYEGCVKLTSLNP